METVAIRGMVDNFRIGGGLDVIARAIRFYLEVTGVKQETSLGLVTASLQAELRAPTRIYLSDKGQTLPLMIILTRLDGGLARDCQNSSITIEPCVGNQSAPALDALMAAMQKKIKEYADTWRRIFRKRFPPHDQGDAVGWQLESRGESPDDALILSMHEVYISP